MSWTRQLISNTADEATLGAPHAIAGPSWNLLCVPVDQVTDSMLIEARKWPTMPTRLSFTADTQMRPQQPSVGVQTMSAFTRRLSQSGGAYQRHLHGAFAVCGAASANLLRVP